MENVELGDRVKDKITGLKGIAIGVTNWIYGCRRITIQPEETKDGAPVDSFTIDEPQIEVIKKAVIASAVPVAAKVSRTHGPRKDVPRRADVRR